MAARWKIASGRSTMSFSAAPGTAKSPATTSTGKPAFSGFTGATTSWSVIFVMSDLPRRPSRNNRSTNFRPTMPAAPRTRTCKSQLLVVFAYRGAVRLLLHGSGHGRHIMLDEEGVKDHKRQRARQRARHQRAPAIDVTVDELVDDGDRHRLVLGRLQEGQRVDELVPAQREAEDERRYQPGDGERQHDLDQDLPAAGAIDQRAFLELERDGLEITHQQPGRERDEDGGVG